jgi:hypothetical protein
MRVSKSEGPDAASGEEEKMKSKATNVRHNTGGKITVDNQSQKTHKSSGVFVNSICTSTEPLYRETVRIKLEPAKTESK